MVRFTSVFNGYRPNGTAGTPSYSFANDTDTGLYLSSAGVIKISIGGTARWVMDVNQFGGATNGHGIIRNEAPTTTNPVFLPSNQDTNTGIGGGDDKLSMIAGGIEGVGVYESGGAITINNRGAVTEKSNILNLDTDSFSTLGIKIIYVNTSLGNVTLGGFSGGAVGQIIHLIKTTQANDLIVENNEGGGFQDIMTPSGADITFDTFGGLTAIFDGTDWYITSYNTI